MVDPDARLARAEATLVVLRGLASRGAECPDRYRLRSAPHAVDRAEARLLLATLDKPIVCVSTDEVSAVRIECRSIEEFFSITSAQLRNLGDLRIMFEQELRLRLAKLSPVAVDDWTVIISAGSAQTNLDVANYLKWMSEYSFRDCVVTEEHQVETTGEYPNMIVRFEVQGDARRDIVFVTPPPSV